jgi:hypothetical protein
MDGSGVLAYPSGSSSGLDYAVTARADEPNALRKELHVNDVLRELDAALDAMASTSGSRGGKRLGDPPRQFQQIGPAPHRSRRAFAHIQEGNSELRRATGRPRSHGSTR